MSASFIVSSTTTSSPNRHDRYKNDEDDPDQDHHHDHDSDTKQHVDSDFNKFVLSTQFAIDKHQSHHNQSKAQQEQQEQNTLNDDADVDVPRSSSVLSMNKGTTTNTALSYSEDLLLILKEVATKGSSSVLPWKTSDKNKRLQQQKQLSDRTSNDGSNSGIYGKSLSNSSTRYHDYYHQTTGSRRNSGSHKRTRMSPSSSSVPIPSRHHLHGSRIIVGGNAAGNSNKRNATTTTTTMTSTMVVEPKSTNLTFINGTVQPTGTTTSNLFVLRSQPSSHIAPPYPNGLFSSNHSTGLVGGAASSTNSTNRFISGVASTAASGSEYDDTSQYECDSEGTSATSNSEMSFSSNISKRRTLSMGNFIGTRNNSSVSFTNMKRSDQLPPPYESVREALRYALSLVLDYYYHNRGGYKISPTEKRIWMSARENNINHDNNTNDRNDETKSSNEPVVINAEEIFLKRKNRLLHMLGRYCDGGLDQDDTNSHSDKATLGTAMSYGNASKAVYPPFTIQRVAEVLMQPERYYTQTHKLCNCMEKLLLITSSANSFGINVKEDTTQSHYEERENVALSKERTRVRSEFRQRHRKSRRKQSGSRIGRNETEQSNAKLKVDKDVITLKSSIRANDNIPDADAEDDDDDEFTSNEMQLDAAARATLRSKFDHVGIDPHSQAAISNSRDVLALMESRRLTNSPPPPPLSSHTAAGLHLHRTNHGSPTSSSSSKSSPSSSPDSNKSMSSPRIPSPLLFQHNNYNNSVLHNENPSRLSPPLAPILSHPTNMPGMQIQQHHTNPSSTSSINQRDVGGVGGDQRSSPHASSSDIDSESDLDDSASDRSDGSDPGTIPSSTFYEPLTAAQAMALNRRHQQVRIQNRHTVTASQQQQQQQQQQQSVGSYSHGIMDGYNSMVNNNNSNSIRVLSNPEIVNQSGSNTGNGGNGGDGSVDSFDSTRAEDSGGSDTSSNTSDHAD